LIAAKTMPLDVVLQSSSGGDFTIDVLEALDTSVDAA
jgi:hypothetical protein